VNLGGARRQAGRYADAHEAYRAALQIDARRPDTLIAYASYQCDVGDFRRGLDYLAQALENNERDPESWGLTGWCHQHLGNAAETLDAFQKAFEYSNEHLFYEKGLANALFMVGRLEEANEHFKAVLQKQKYQTSADQSGALPRRDPNPLVPRDALALLGWCNYRLGRFDEAIRLFQTVLAEASHEYSPLWFDLALVLLASGRHELGFSGYQHACDTVAKESPIGSAGCTMWRCSISSTRGDTASSVRKPSRCSCRSAIDSRRLAQISRR
jgi:tetratricopeptide (TPR) repeat protein